MHIYIYMYIYIYILYINAQRETWTWLNMGSCLGNCTCFNNLHLSELWFGLVNLSVISPIGASSNLLIHSYIDQKNCDADLPEMTWPVCPKPVQATSTKTSFFATYSNHVLHGFNPHFHENWTLHYLWSAQCLCKASMKRMSCGPSLSGKGCFNQAALKLIQSQAFPQKIVD